MKINTDGVLLGAMVLAENPSSILDIGTGTGVIALMLAQRFTNAHIDAVEIDTSAAKTAGNNFANSPFSVRMTVFPASIRAFFDEHPVKKYDLIVSNPPFFINSLESPKAKTTLAKHTDTDFFESLVKDVSAHLLPTGACWFILPVQTVALIKSLAIQNGMYLQKEISIRSFGHSEPHREIVCFGFEEKTTEITNITIYEAAGVYTSEYKILLQPFFLNY
ncbi:tRNA1(Val) (adenine(37)-N6)-methyltransferase [Mucilaginibacter flavidus]|uniref:tRNA1(Val) (adenine(37)-N6)-methyltransferase n=1 Tax=Mucilaginibacter flavidus TaxID=2949309 RepID=UPI002093EA64|nr:methyltransferase [Mucilaginibacter flavidus]MCO5948167.1 methyltransferase [Mucilaginibacter flavidus]